MAFNVNDTPCSCEFVRQGLNTSAANLGQSSSDLIMHNVRKTINLMDTLIY